MKACVFAFELLFIAVKQRSIHSFKCAAFDAFSSQRAAKAADWPLVTSPGGVELFNELVGVDLSFASCRIAIKRFVSDLAVFGNIPAETAGATGVGFDNDLEVVSFGHRRIMGRS